MVADRGCDIIVDSGDTTRIILWCQPDILVSGREQGTNLLHAPLIVLITNHTKPWKEMVTRSEKYHVLNYLAPPSPTDLKKVCANKLSITESGDSSLLKILPTPEIPPSSSRTDTLR